MSKDTFHPTLPAHLISQLKNEAGRDNAKRAWPAGNTYSGSKFLGHAAEIALWLWTHAPYASPVSHHLAYVDANGTLWFRSLQLLEPSSVRKRFPYNISMKDEKKRYYRKRLSEYPFATNREIEEKVRAKWLVFQVALWGLSDREKRSLALPEGNRVEENGCLTQREALFRIPESRRCDAVGIDRNGGTTKTVDIPFQTEDPVLREVIVGLEDYAQRKSSAVTELAVTELSHDRIEFPVSIPARNMALSVVIDKSFLGRKTYLEMELRNQEKARFGGDDPTPPEMATESLGRYIPISRENAEGETSRGVRALIDRLQALQNENDEKGEPVIDSEEGNQAIDKLGAPKRYTFLRVVCPWPPLGQEICVRWKMPD